jgi:hypothetical protein
MTCQNWLGMQSGYRALAVNPDHETEGDELWRITITFYSSVREIRRSIMTEAILNAKGNPTFTAFSAGSYPAGTVRPEALKQLELAHLPTEGLRSKNWNNKPKDMGGLYSALKEDLPTRLAEAERIGYGFCFAEGSYSKCSTRDPHCMDCRISGLPRCAPVLLRLTSALSGLRIRGKACLARLPVRVKPPIPEAALQKEEPLWVPYLAPHWTWIN